MKPGWWEWPSILCIEAPVIALLWQNLSARVLGVPLAIRHRILLGIAVWIAYAADRGVDSIRGERSDPRHRFIHRRRREVFIVGSFLVVFGAIYAALRLLPNERLFYGFAFGSAVALVGGVRRLRTGGYVGERIWRGASATVFLIGVLLFALPRGLEALPGISLWALGLWAVFYGNLAVIARAESRAKAVSAAPNSGDAQGFAGDRCRGAWFVVGVAVAVAGSIVCWTVAAAPNGFVWAVPGALWTLLIVDTLRPASPEVSHAAADLVLVVAPIVSLWAGT